MQEKSLSLLLRLKHLFASRALLRTPMRELTTLPHTPLLTGQDDPLQTPPYSAPLAPKSPKSAFGALMFPSLFKL